MSLRMYQLGEGPMTLTGSKVLELIQDNYTPPIDILVREAIQNSADAILAEKEFGKIMFKIGSFVKFKLSSSLEKIGKNIDNLFKEKEYDFLSISDSNTCGLLGKATKSESGKPNNLYSLVYDIMNRKGGTISGGSHGIGKSVYYRYGTGICFYYSRTFENGEYINKLAGTLIQDETKDNCLLGKHTSGIAYFGMVNNSKPEPIYDDVYIENFLSIFGLKLLGGTDTGTTVIIPFINKEKMLLDTVNDNNSSCFWQSDFESALNISIQRWYFARVNNTLYNGKYLKVAINNKKIELNTFFLKLQELYNETLNDIKVVSVISTKLQGDILGKFKYKLFNKNELGMTPPENLPTLRLLTDSPYDVDEKGLLFYMRKPGMVINYNNSKFGNYCVDEDSLLIGMFVLNDDASFNNENIGDYMRKSEEANHKEWNDINEERFAYLKTKKPFKQICTIITKKLTEEFKETKAISLEGSNTILQKKLGEKLLPPSGFGDKAEPPKSNLPGEPKSKKVKKAKIEFLGSNEKGVLSYSVDVLLNSLETAILKMNIKVGGKTYNFDQWEMLNFRLPLAIERIEIEELYLEKKKINSPQNISLDENFIKRRAKSIGNELFYKVRGISTSENNIPCGLKIQNYQKKKMQIKIKILVKPLDCKYLIGFDVLFSEVSI